MVTVVTLIMWVILSDGSQTYTYQETEGLTECLMDAQKYLQQDPAKFNGQASYAAGCIVRKSPVS